MERKQYAVCPRCGSRADITKIIRDRQEDRSVALIKCSCGKSQMSYSESRFLKIDLNNPYMREDHFDLLLPPGWNQEMWNKVSACLPDR